MSTTWQFGINTHIQQRGIGGDFGAREGILGALNILGNCSQLE